MKITKSQLKQIIKEEMTNLLEGYRGYGYRAAQKNRDAMEKAVAKSPMRQGRLAAKAGGPKEYPEGFTEKQKESFDKGYEDEKGTLNDPDSDDDDAAELRSGLDLTGFELKKERNGFYIIDSESGQKVLGPFSSEGQAEERRNDPALRGDYDAAKSILSKRMGDFSSEKNI